MKYEFLIRVKDHPLSSPRNYWKGIVDESRFDDCKHKFEIKKRIMEKSGDYSDVFLLINRLTDDGDFIEVVL